MPALDHGARHGARADRDVGAVAHRLAQLGELVQRGREVDVGEQHVPALRPLDPRGEGRTLAAVGLIGAHGLQLRIFSRGRGEQLGRAVAAAVVDDEDLQEVHPGRSRGAGGFARKRIEQGGKPCLLVVGGG